MNEKLRVLAAPGLSDKDQNPYVWLLYTRMRSVQIDNFQYGSAWRKKYDIVHYHWPESPFNYSGSAAGAVVRALRQFAVMEILRARGARVIWTVHNLHSHEHKFPNVERIFWALFTRRLDGVIALSESGRKAAVERFPALHNKAQFVIPHGTYTESYPAAPAGARERLQIPASSRVALLIGQIRRYKNATGLIQTFRASLAKGWLLMIAGRPHNSSLADELREQAGDDPQVHLDLRYLSEAEVSDYLSAADLVVLPYSEILNSGSALLALSFNKPVLVPALGALQELAAEAGTSWVRTYEGSLSPEILDSAFQWAAETDRPYPPALGHLNWESISQATRAAYCSVIASTARRFWMKQPQQHIAQETQPAQVDMHSSTE